MLGCFSILTDSNSADQLSQGCSRFMLVAVHTVRLEGKQLFRPTVWTAKVQDLYFGCTHFVP